MHEDAKYVIDLAQAATAAKSESVDKLARLGPVQEMSALAKEADSLSDAKQGELTPEAMSAMASSLDILIQRLWYSVRL